MIRAHANEVTLLDTFNFIPSVPSKSLTIFELKEATKFFFVFFVIFFQPNAVIRDHGSTM